MAVALLWVLATGELSRRCAVRSCLLSPLVAAPAWAASTHAQLEFTSAVEGPLGSLQVQLESRSNADAVRVFAALCEGTLAAPCDKTIADQGLLEKEKLENMRALRSCLETEGVPVSYSGSQVWRVVAGERIDCGDLSSRYGLRSLPAVVGDNDGGRLSHDRAGVVSLRRGTDGGGAFVITAAPLASLDADYVIVGRVADEAGLDLIRRLAQLPTVNSARGVGYQALAGDIASRPRPVKGCRYGGSDLYCTAGRPIRKITMRTALV